MNYPGMRLLLFAREPLVGRVKTRLVPVLGADGAADLYQQLLHRQIDVLVAATPCPLQLWVDGDPWHPAFQNFPGERYQQQGRDLGERLEHALCTALPGSQGVLLIGSDCPGLDATYLEQALAGLAQDAELVVGPARDGGYVLLGLRRAAPSLFRGVEWGSGRVLEQTLEAARAEGLRTRLLPELADVDRPEDLAMLAGYGIYPNISRRLLAGGNEH